MAGARLSWCLWIVGAAACSSEEGARSAGAGSEPSAQSAELVRRWAKDRGEVLHVTVTDVTSGQRVRSGRTFDAPFDFQVTVATDGIDCAGQFVVTALGAPGAPPSVLVQSKTFILGPAVGADTVTGETLTAWPLAGGTNRWKISASCNGTGEREIYFDAFEFQVGS